MSLLSLVTHRNVLHELLCYDGMKHGVCNELSIGLSKGELVCFVTWELSLWTFLEYATRFCWFGAVRWKLIEFCLLGIWADTITRDFPRNKTITDHSLVLARLLRRVYERRFPYRTNSSNLMTFYFDLFVVVDIDLTIIQTSTHIVQRYSVKFSSSMRINHLWRYKPHQNHDMTSLHIRGVIDK